MSETQTKLLNIFAPVKINLYLHVTGRLDNGYHMLDSLVAFADIGDNVAITPASDFKFEIDGPYAQAFTPKERDSSPHSSNLIVQAVWALARAAQKNPQIHIKLTKNLPLASGLGGGSSDAASVIWGLLQWWGISAKAPYLPDIMASLGADVPVCLQCRPARIRGIGDILDPAPPMNEVPIILINPEKTCSTAGIFQHYSAPFKELQPLPPNLENFKTLINFLKNQSNDLQNIACQKIPGINNVISALQGQKGCSLARMSGSGASVFGLFEHEKDALLAAQTLSDDNPDWWVKMGWLGRPERY